MWLVVLGVMWVMAMTTASFWLDWQAGLLMFGAWWLCNIITIIADKIRRERRI